MSKMSYDQTSVEFGVNNSIADLDTGISKIAGLDDEVKKLKQNLNDATKRLNIQNWTNGDFDSRARVLVIKIDNLSERFTVRDEAFKSDMNTFNDKIDDVIKTNNTMADY